MVCLCRFRSDWRNLRQPTDLMASSWMEVSLRWEVYRKARILNNVRMIQRRDEHAQEHLLY